MCTKKKKEEHSSDLRGGALFTAARDAADAHQTVLEFAEASEQNQTKAEVPATATKDQDLPLVSNDDTPAESVKSDGFIQEDALPMSQFIMDASPSDSGEPIGTKLRALSNTAHMDVIDKLRDLGVHEFVELPQLVVVGDQSSGKSSVLEAITDVPFPRDATLCTRFATNITLRRQPTENVHVSIIPGKSASQDKAEKLRNWSYETKKLDGTNFLKALEQASRAMGVRVSSETGDDVGKTFSDDIFKVEITGPHLINLSVIDVPGIFRAKQEGETTQEDIILVEEMVKSYIQNPRSIILAVFACNNDIATQSILGMVEQADPEGRRTVGVLTKPDLLDKGTEYTIMDLVNGKKHKLALGYYVLRNRGKREQGCTRSEMEVIERMFFNAHPWNQLPRDRVGLEALLIQLQQLHEDIIDREFPAIKSQIEKLVVKCKQDLAHMGQERNSEADQRRFLERIANQFQDICRDAMDTSYHRHLILRKGIGMRLPTSVANRKNLFGKEMTWKGHSMAFVDTDLPNKDTAEPDDVEEAEDTIPPDGVDSEEVEHDHKSEAAKKHDDLDVHLSYLDDPCLLKHDTTSADKHYPELDDLIIPKNETAPSEHRNIKKWIEGEVLDTRSYTLEVLAPNILPLLWKQQIEKWEGISLLFIRDIIVLVHRFIFGLLDEVCPDIRTRRAILALMKDEILAKYRQAIEQVKFLFQVEQDGTPLTENHYFGDTLRKVREERSSKVAASALKQLYVDNSASSDEPRFVDYESIIRVSDLEKLKLSHTNKSNLEHAVDDLHDILYCYYKTARKRYVDAVLMQAMDWYLLKGSPSPLHLFTPSYVSDLTPEQLEKVAGEAELSKNKRRELKKEITALEEAKEVMRGF